MQDIQDIYELSPLQEGILFHSLFAPESRYYCQQLKATLHGRLDVDAFQRTWQKVVDRHSVFRTSFHWEEIEKPLQVVHQSATIPWRLEDLSGLPVEAQRTYLDQCLVEDRAQRYDLTNAPLVRLGLFRLGPEVYRFVWSFHHLLMDGWCLPIILQEVFLLYESFTRNVEVRLRQPRPYRDYIVWLQRQDTSKAKQFWRESLAGFTVPTPLVIDDSTVNGTSYSYDFRDYDVTLSDETLARLTAFTRKHQLTMNTVIQGAWAVMLSRYSGQDDVVFGTVVSGRPTSLPGVESIVGLLINTLPVRVHLPREQEVVPWLKGVQDWLAEMRQFEFSSLAEVQTWSDVPRSKSLFESLLVFENYPVDPALGEEVKSLEITDTHYSNVNNYPLSLIALPTSRGLTFRVKYDGRRFQKQTIERLQAHLHLLLARLTKDAPQKLADLWLLTPGEQQKIIVGWNDTRVDYSPERCVHELIEQQVEKSPAATAVVYEEQKLSYRELNERANQLAHYLKARGVGPETLVGIFMRRSAEMIVGILGVLKAGGVYFPLDPGFPRQRLAYMFEQSKAQIILTLDRFADALPEGGFEILALDKGWQKVAGYSSENPTPIATPENGAYVIYTSGSTGQPKGVVIEHRQIYNYVRALMERLEIPPGLSYAMVQPLTVDSCKTVIFPSLVSGGSLHLVAHEVSPDPYAMAGYFEKHDIDLLKIAPSHLAAIQGTQPARVMPRRWLVIGGEASRAEWVESLQKLDPARRIFNHYGPTEATVGMLTYPLKPERIGNHNTVLPMGKPLPNTQAYLLDESLRAVPVGVAGELYIGGACVARGYLNHPDLTAEKFVPDPFNGSYGARLYKTGDQARYLSDGNIEFLGRIDDQIKIRGFRIEPKEIEAVCREDPSVKDVIVLAREQESGIPKLIAYLVFQPGTEPAISKIRNTLKKRLPDYMVPAAYVTLDALPLNPHGKTDRRALPDPEPGREETDGRFVGPTTPLEANLADVFAQVLGIDQVGVNDNFFELGGHSLMLTNLLFHLNEKFQLELPLRAVFDAPTVAELAPVLVQSRARLLNEDRLNTILAEIEQLSEDEVKWMVAT
jgi:surfactin family lipopeptide synthetase C